MAGELLVNHNIPLPRFFISVDCEGVENICFDRVLQVFILRDLLVNNLRRGIREVLESETGKRGPIWRCFRPAGGWKTGLTVNDSTDVSTSQVLFT